MPPAGQRVWRAFPWDPRARDDEPFSPSYLPMGQGSGRFDLPGRPDGVLYTAETPEHAIAERIQQYRGRVLEDADLVVARHRLALVAMEVPLELREGVADLCDARVLVKLRVRPDDTASRHRATTQRIAASVYAGGHTGLRWWSAFFGDWHAVVLFRDRLAARPRFDVPEPLTPGHQALRDAAGLLGLALARR
jgi:hypothetical protein